jgi:hypothetical protein
MTASLVQLAGVLLIFTAGGATCWFRNLLLLVALKWASRVAPQPNARRGGLAMRLQALGGVSVPDLLLIQPSIASEKPTKG